MFLWWYGVIPHLWLTWADNELELAFRPLARRPRLGHRSRTSSPSPSTSSTIRDLIAVVIYVVGLGLRSGSGPGGTTVQKRAEAAAAVVPTSTYGRPLVRKG